MCTNYWLSACSSLPRKKSVVRVTDRPAMTIAVDLGRKATKQTKLYVHSSFAIILMGKRELNALLSVSSWCLLIVVWLFLAVPWVCVQFVIFAFPDNTHYFYVILACLLQGIWVAPYTILINIR